MTELDQFSFKETPTESLREKIDELLQMFADFTERLRGTEEGFVRNAGKDNKAIASVAEKIKTMLAEIMAELEAIYFELRERLQQQVPDCLETPLSPINERLLELMYPPMEDLGVALSPEEEKLSQEGFIMFDSAFLAPKTENIIMARVKFDRENIFKWGGGGIKTVVVDFYKDKRISMWRRRNNPSA